MELVRFSVSAMPIVTGVEVLLLIAEGKVEARPLSTDHHELLVSPMSGDDYSCVEKLEDERTWALCRCDHILLHPSRTNLLAMGSWKWKMVFVKSAKMMMESTVREFLFNTRRRLGSLRFGGEES